MEFHEAANIFPMMTAEEMAGLVDSIRQGYDSQFPILTYEEKILDGRNRYVACLKAGIEPVYSEWTGSDPVGFVVRANLDRRHLTSSQKAVIALDVERALAEQAKKRQQGGQGGVLLSQIIDKANSEPIHAAQQAADMVGTNRQYIHDAKNIEREAPDLLDKVRAGELTIPKAIQETRKRQMVAELESVEAKEAKAVEGVYDVIVIDPPWPMQKIERDVAPNQVAFEYPVMDLEDIQALQIPSANNCHIWLWTTQRYLPYAFDILEAWGLKYVCTFTWHKSGGFQPFGLPQYNCEFALYARKGTPEFIDFKDFMTCFNAPRGAHSEKPEEFYDMVRRVTVGRRLDMFNRRNIIGFDGWGKESCQ